MCIVYMRTYTYITILHWNQNKHVDRAKQFFSLGVLVVVKDFLINFIIWRNLCYASAFLASTRNFFQRNSSCIYLLHSIW